MLDFIVIVIPKACYLRTPKLLASPWGTVELTQVQEKRHVAN